MGGLFGSKAPKMPAPPPPPPTVDDATEKQAQQDAARRRRGMQASIYTSPSGLTGSGKTGQKTLLGS
jgi:hypothetical protein